MCPLPPGNLLFLLFTKYGLLIINIIPFSITFCNSKMVTIGSTVQPCWSKINALFMTYVPRKLCHIVNRDF